MEESSLKMIVTTTINSPTEAIRRFDSLEDWHLIVIGDLKTPKDYELSRGTYVSPEEQQDRFPQLSEAIGWNCIQRRNIGFVIALEAGADIIATVDDDNIPMADWGQRVHVDQPITVREYRPTSEAFDPIGATNYPHLWHRGYPLQLVHGRDYSNIGETSITPSVQADFWNGDPDIDAICRLEHRPVCAFETGAFPMASSIMGPFNSQNTFLSARVFPDYFLFPHIGRMDDLWASYHIQAQGHRVVYAEPSVYQARNDHDLIVDMKNEYLGYENNLQLVRDLARDQRGIEKFLPASSLAAWDEFRTAIS